MVMNNEKIGMLLEKLENINRNTVYDILPDDIKEYSERVAFNSKQLFAELLKRKVYSDYADLNIENLNVIQEAVKYFDIGFAIDSQKLKENYGNKIIPVEHVTIGSELFFFDVKKREDFLSLSIEERNLRRIAKEVALYHHERWNGKGYPYGLKMEEIPIIARICAICFAFETFTNGSSENVKDRYEAIKEMEKLSGIDLDPLIFEVFTDIIPLLAVKGEIYSVNEEIEVKQDEVQKEEEIEEVEEVKEEVKEVKKVKKTSRPIEMLFSPVKDIKKNKTIYYKSKLVLNDRYHGVLMPVVYSGIAEKSGKITDIVLIGLQQAIDFISYGKENDIGFEGVFIKMYPSIIERETNLSRVLKLIDKSEVKTEKLIFEIPETTLINKDEKIIQNIKLIKKKKIKIAISEFGEEYSSLNKLSEIDFDMLLIGSTYTKNITKNTKASGVVRGLIDLAKNLDVEDICENVNSKEQYEILKKIGCTKVEGKAIGEAVPYKEII